MSRTVKCGLIQAKNAGPTDAPIEEIKRLNVEKHLRMIEDAAKQGVQILCMQEVFTTPYFCAEQQTRWYEAVEKIPPHGGHPVDDLQILPSERDDARPRAVLAGPLPQPVVALAEGAPHHAATVVAANFAGERRHLGA